MAENNSLPPLMTDKELLMEGSAYSEIMAAAFEYADAYCASGDEPRRYSHAIDHLRKTVRAEITRFSRGNYAALPATEDSSAGDLAAVQAEPVAEARVEQVSPRHKKIALELMYGDLPPGVHLLYAAPQAQPADAPIAYLQESDQHLLHRFIETTEDDESFDIGKDAVKRLANLGVVESCGFGRYGVTMFGYWVHEHYWHQNPSLPLKTNADRDREHRAAMAAAQEGGNAAKEA